MPSLIAFDVIDLPLLHIKTGIKQIIIIDLKENHTMKNF